MVTKFRRFGCMLWGALMLVVSGAALATADTDVNFSVTTSSPGFTAPNGNLGGVSGCALVGGNHFYDTVTFRANGSGTHSVSTTALTGFGGDNFIAVYSGVFNPQTPGADVIGCNDDAMISPNTRWAAFSTSLTSGQIYTGVVTSYGAGTSGSGVVGSGTYRVSPSVTIVYTLSGVISGLTSSETLVLQNQSANNISLTANGGFSFPNVFDTNDTYAVTILTSPAGKSCTVTNGSGTIGTSNVRNVNVTCVALTTTLAFDTQGGSAVSPEVLTIGSSYTLPAAPTRTGYSFAGWNTSADGSGTSYAAGDSYTVPGSATTLYAQWTLNTYAVAYDANGATSGAVPSAQTKTHGVDLTLATNSGSLVKTGYSFNGWNTSANGTGIAYAAGASYTANEAVTLYAQWVINNYTITFDSAGGTAVVSITDFFGATVTAPAAPAREGYTFSGWSPTVPTTMPAANTTLTAQWTVNSYTITFDSAGGSAVAPVSANFGTAVIAPANPTREGYTFSGWSPTVPTTMPAANTTLTAQWTVNSYTITFDSAGGSAVAPISANFGTAVTAPANPSREGFTFIGWEPAVPATMPAQNLTLTALYEQIQLTVTATVTGEASISPATQQVNYGSSASVELSLVNADDIVVLAGTCEAAVSGTQIQTVAIKQACTIAVTVYPFTQVEKDTDAALASNGTSRFSFVSGAGSKTLLGATVVRSGVESELELADAEALLTLQSDGSYIFSAQRTGRYTLEFVDAVSGEVVQVVYSVFPYLAFTSSQQPVQQNVATTVRVWLSDEPVEYPVTAAVLKDGVSSELQNIQFTAEHQLLRTYRVTATATPARLIVQEAGINNALVGTPAVHTLAVQQEVPALALTVKATQNNAETYVVTQTDGLVNLSASELNATEASYNWTASGITLSTSGATASFDPSALAEGRFTITVTAQSESGRTGQYDLALRVIADCPVENCAGAGTSGIPAEQNNVADSPNRLPLCPDVTEENRVGSCQVEGSQALYAEVPNQYQLTLGALTEEQSWSTGQFGIALNDDSLMDAGFVQQGLVINFDVLGLENPGEVVPVAIPLPAGTSIPSNAVWRKFINGQWQNFVVNAANRIDSAARDVLGQCPGVSSDNWSSGLTAGHGCVRLTIQDGGPNDDDGVANSVIRDPGVLAVAEVVVVPPPVPVPPKDITAKSGGIMGGVFSLLLGGIAALRLRKIVMAAALLPLSLSAQDLYLGADGLSVGHDSSSAEVTRAMNSAGIAGAAVVEKDTKVGFRLYGGYQLSENIAIEFGWLDTGDITTQFTGVAPGTELRDFEAVWPTSGEGVELSLLWQPVTVAELFKPGLRLGVWKMEASDTVFDSADIARQSKNETVPFVELQGQWTLNADWSLKMGVSYYDVNSADLRTAQLGLIRRF